MENVRHLVDVLWWDSWEVAGWSALADALAEVSAPEALVGEVQKAARMIQSRSIFTALFCSMVVDNVAKWAGYTHRGVR